MIFGLVACASNTTPKIVVDANKSREIDNNSTTEKKIKIIDLDKVIKQSKEDSTKGGLREKIIPIFLKKYVGDNDEVAFKEGTLNKIKNIKIGDNNEVAFTGREYRIKTSELKDGTPIIIKYNKGKEVRLRVRIH
ncbi:hypothetical protein MNB_SV-14-69 [hydrothermal vent metagenome]|uniref:Uncharacterized protein n=1 Tax=hydrothermal vent metagenome TaxID=652676 RepID=A0A1W1CJR2_9ZZZZ